MQGKIFDDAYFRNRRTAARTAGRARKILLLILACLLGAGICSGGELFHNGSTGNCDGCHSKTRKSSAGGVFGGLSSLSGNSMLNGTDPGSTCLICHQAAKGSPQPFGHLVATHGDDVQTAPPGQLSPGGDFAWLKKSYKWSSDAAGAGSRGDSSPGERHGHNIIAADFGYDADTSNVLTPEGSYPAEGLSCISCHDPHGTYRRNGDGSISTAGLQIVASGSYKSSPEPGGGGSVGTYRMLAGKGYQPKSLQGELPFKADPPAAVSPMIYNRSERTTDTRVAYGSGMSEWCRNCHTATHEGESGHPAGNKAKLSAEVTKHYNSYVSSGDRTGKTGSSYTSLVPFESGTTDYQTLKALANSDGSVNSGATGSANVMCLSCHRAHASAWDYLARWNLRGEMIMHDGKFPGTDNGAPASVSQGRTTDETRQGLYDRLAGSFGAYQRGLCSKCHAKD